MTELEKYKDMMVGWRDLYHHQQEQMHKQELEGWANLLELGLKSNHEGLEFSVQTVLTQIKRRTQ